MSLYNRTYGPINEHTTMFTGVKKNHPSFTGFDKSKFSKTLVRYDKPHTMQYPGRFNTEKWYVVNRQYYEVMAKKKHTAKRRVIRAGDINRSICCHGNRRIRIRLATPKWITRAQRDEISRMKRVVKKLNIIFGCNTYSRDHIIPLSGDLVSGLNIPENMRIVKTKLNTAKGNTYEID